MPRKPTRRGGALPNESDLLLIPEVAPLIRASVWTVRRLIADGELEATKIRGRWFVHPEAVEKLLRPNNDGKRAPAKRATKTTAKRAAKRATRKG